MAYIPLLAAAAFVAPLIHAYEIPAGSINGTSIALNPANFRSICDSDPAWISLNFDAGHCALALYQLSLKVEEWGEDTPFMICAPGAKPEERLPVVTAPMRFEHDTCTLDITMMSGFKKGELPNMPKWKYDVCDLTTPGQIYQQSKDLYNGCMSRGGQRPISPGYQPFGSRGPNIAAFYSATDSTIDKKIRSMGAGSLEIESSSGTVF